MSDGRELYAARVYIVQGKSTIIEVPCPKSQAPGEELEFLTWDFGLGSWDFYGLGTSFDSHMRDTTSQASYWNRVAHEKRFTHPLCAEWLSRYMEPRALILDYGCGYGRTLADLRAAGHTNSVGLDSSGAMLARCRSLHPRQSLIQSDGHILPFKDNAFNAVLLFAVLTCIPPDTGQLALVEEIKRVLRPCGLLYLSDLLLDETARNRERYERFVKAYGTYGIFELPEGVVVRHHSQAWIAKLTASFEQLEYEPFTVVTMNGNNSPAFQYLGRK